MNQTITVYQGKRPGGTPPSFLGEDAAKKVRAFHRSLEEYCETPLVSLDSMAKRLGVGGIYVKDESKRFGLNAFKALGASYAVHELLSAQYGQNAENAGGAAGMNAGSAAGTAAGYGPSGVSRRKREGVCDRHRRKPRQRSRLVRLESGGKSLCFYAEGFPDLPRGGHRRHWGDEGDGDGLEL